MNKTSQLNAFNTVGQKFTQQFANKSFKANDLQTALLSFLKQNGLNEFITYGSSISSQLNSAANAKFYGNFNTAGSLTDCGVIIHTGPCTSPTNVIQYIDVTLSFNGKNVTTSIPGTVLTQKRTSDVNAKFIKYAQSSVSRAIDYIMHYFDYELTHIAATKSITLDLTNVTKMKSMVYHELIDTLKSTAEYKIDMSEFNRLFGNGMLEVGKEVEVLMKNGKFVANSPEFLSLVKQFTAKMHNASQMMIVEKRVEVLRILAHDLNIDLKSPSINHAEDVEIYRKIQNFLKLPGNANIKLKILGEPGSVESKTYLAALEHMFREQGGINSKNANLYKRYWNAAKKDTGYKGAYMGIEDAPKVRKGVVPGNNGNVTPHGNAVLPKQKINWGQFIQDFIHVRLFSLKAFKNQGLTALWSVCMLMVIVNNPQVIKKMPQQGQDVVKNLHLNVIGTPCWFITMPYVALANWFLAKPGMEAASNFWKQIMEFTRKPAKDDPAKIGNDQDGYIPVSPDARGMGQLGIEIEKEAKKNKFQKPKTIPGNIPKSSKNTNIKPSKPVYQGQSRSENNIGNREQQIKNRDNAVKELLGGD